MSDVGNIYCKSVTDLSDIEGGGNVSYLLERDNNKGYGYIFVVSVSL
jgi:hypothetical protein